jgi:nucleoside-diphosphate-sugar epimerase
LGFKAKVSLEEGIKNIVMWFFASNQGLL